ncbi:MAG: beta-ketoacyl synthase N-terminal-like domain-containing protein [Planctomycetota bacterium]
MSPTITIAGLGLITPMGMGAWETFRALQNGKTIVDRAAGLPPDIPPLQIPGSLGGIGIARHCAADPAVELAERAAREAATMAGVGLEGVPTYLGTSKGAVARLSSRLGRGQPLGESDQRNLALGPHGYLASELQRRTGLKPRTHHVAACASSLFALDSARRALLAHQGAEYALVVTADAALTPAFISSYRRLGVLAELTPEGYRQRPLDQARRGFVLSEMGAAVLLRRCPVSQQPAAGAIKLVDSAVATEAYDMVRTRASMQALEHVAHRLLPGRCVDVLHPHAPGTAEHDPSELNTLLQVLNRAPDAPPNPIDLYAVKGAIGHGLGAAGLASLVIAALCLTTGQLPPMPWLSRPMPSLSECPGLPGPVRATSARTCDRTGTHAVFAAGFGGHTAGAVIRRAG